MPGPRHLGGNHPAPARLSETIDLTLYLASDSGVERENQRYQDMLERVEIILDYNRRE